MRAGIFQCAGGGLRPEQRLQKLADRVDGSDLDLIVCPELFLSGYKVGDDLRSLAELYDGPMTGEVRKIAQSSGTAIVFGYPEREGDKIYNSAACISAKGELIANHRKLMVPPGFEGQYFEPGDGLTLFDLGGMRCAILVCFDAEFPEAVRAVAKAGAQVVIVPTALGEKWPVVADRVMPTRAFENGIWFMYANHAGVENDARYLGHSCIVSPEGKDVARAGATEQLISCEIDIESVVKAQNRLPFLQQSDALKRRLGS